MRPFQVLSCAGLLVLCYVGPMAAQVARRVGFDDVGYRLSEFGSSEELVDAINRNNYRRIGVLPRMVVRSGFEERLGGSIGPQADYLPERIVESLLDVPNKRFQVVDSMQMAGAVRELTRDDLGRPDTLQRVAEKVRGLDALIVVAATDRRTTRQGRSNPLELQLRLWDIKTAQAVAVVREELHISLADAAYMGESWELRRWRNRRLVNVGIEDSLDRILVESPEEYASHDYISFGSYRGEGVGGIGPDFGGEGPSFGGLKGGLRHPLLDGTYPFPMEVTVDGGPRRMVQIEDKLFVVLDPGEEYRIRIWNRSGHDVYMALFVDGMNVLGKRREHPSNCRYWALRSKQDPSTFSGWYAATSERGVFREERFIISPADQTVAGQEGFDAKLGMITAVFYTVGTPRPEGTRAKRLADGTVQLPDGTRVAVVGPSPGGRFGTGTGTDREVVVKQFRGAEPGLILAATTIHYRTSRQLEELRR